MSDILIRNVSDRLRHRLKREAARKGASMQAQANEALEDWVTRKEREDQEWWDNLDALRRQIGPVDFDSVRAIREDRDSDHGRDADYEPDE